MVTGDVPRVPGEEPSPAVATLKRLLDETQGAMAIADFFARKELEGVGELTDALHAIRETLKPFIKPLRDEDVAFLGGDVKVRPEGGS